ncbi:PhzF family phenazine biosynthesis protein [Actinoplanes sp. NPDC049599]|uniref:PhzF family phenazine biosynthesis protein n=1 Tax=Actinoplanes sp. NPDC049599 TaxID=3363903 RepID=UPI0037AE21C9
MRILRYAAFSDDPAGGNPAGVVLDAGTLSDAEMQAVAADVGYAETAFLTERRGPATYRVRYFSPLAEVPFCGHATVGTAVALADRDGPGALTFVTNVGAVPVTVDDRRRATLTSVGARVADLAADDLTALLAALRWQAADLDPALPPRVAYAGAFHPVIAAGTRQRLADLDYDVPALKALMQAREWTTIQLVWRETTDRFEVRNPFPVGGLYEDPATGAAAAALGGYLRAEGLVPDGTVVHVAQGGARITVTLTPGEDGVRVSGTAVPIPG